MKKTENIFIKNSNDESQIMKENYLENMLNIKNELKLEGFDKNNYLSFYKETKFKDFSKRKKIFPHKF